MWQRSTFGTNSCTRSFAFVILVRARSLARLVFRGSVRIKRCADEAKTGQGVAEEEEGLWMTNTRVRHNLSSVMHY
jgi:hypothetical protein